MSRPIVLSLLSLLVAVPASAQLITDLAAIPVAARGPGLQGTQWVTDLTIHNPMDHPMNAFLALLGGDGEAAALCGNNVGCGSKEDPEKLSGERAEEGSP